MMQKKRQLKNINKGKKNKEIIVLEEVDIIKEIKVKVVEVEVNLVEVEEMLGVGVEGAEEEEIID